MKTNVLIVLFVSIVALVAYHVLTLYDLNFPYGRMWETPAVRPHNTPLPIMDAGVVPFDQDSEALYRATPGEELVPPVTAKDAAAVSAGKKLYFIYCAQCHGKQHDGNGTVGQSFAPLPTDLRLPRVQALPNGKIFKEIGYGLKDPAARQPPLASTITIDDRWRIVAYVKSLGPRPSPVE